MSNQLVSISGTNVPVIEYRDQRVITFNMIDDVHQRPTGTARKRFNDNRKHFIEGDDFYHLDSISLSVFRTNHPGLFGDGAQRGILVTQMGYLMIVKSFTDDLAWQVQRQLVKGYFASNDDKDLATRVDRLESIINQLPHLQPTPPPTFENDWYRILTEFVTNKGKVHTRTLCDALELDHPSQNDYRFSEKYFPLVNLTGLEDLSGLVKLFI